MTGTVPRDSEHTRLAILDALERLLVEKGFTGVGVNAVAREAGVDKVLIYRYFGSMEGLLEAFRDGRDLSLRISEVLDEFPRNTPVSSIVTRLLLKGAKAFRENDLARELARWELTEKNPLTVAYSRSLEKNELKTLEDRGIKPDKDTVVAVTLLLCGLNYMALRQSIKNPIMEIDLSHPETMKRVERVVEDLVERYFQGREEVPYVR